MSAQYTASFGSPVNSLDALAGTTATNGTEYALPGNKACAITWQVIFSSAPSAVNVVLQLSNDGVTFVTADTSTLTTGEIRTVNTSAKFVRARLVSKTGGGTTTVSLVTQPYAVSITTYNGDFDQALNTTDDVAFNGLALTDPLPIASGGLGVVLADPNADRILFWDDSAGQYDWLIPGTNLSITDKTLNAAGGSAVWGGITGTLSAQTDLQSALDAKGNGNVRWIGPFTVQHNTASLNAGVTIDTYTPVVGDFLCDIRLVIGAAGNDAFNGTTPKGDVGYSAEVNGFYARFNGAVSLSSAEGNLGDGHVSAPDSSNSSLVGSWLASAGGLANSSPLPWIFLDTTPLKVWVSQDGNAGGAAVGGTEGILKVFLQIATAAA